MAAEVAALERGGVPGPTEPGPERRRGRLEPYLFFSPVILLFIVCLAVPIVDLVKYSLSDANLYQGAVGWNNFENFTALWSPAFARTTWTTVLWMVGCIAGVLLVGVPIALLLNKPIPGRGLFRSLVVIPWIVPHAFAAIMWSWVLNPQFGILNTLLLKVGITDEPLVLLSQDTALATVIVVRVWQSCPFIIISVLAALQSVPRDLEEAAGLDGANAFQRFRYVVLPHIAPVLAASTLLIGAWTLQLFDTVYILTGGGPNHATDILAVDIYNKVFVQSDLGGGSAIAVVTLLIVLIISVFAGRAGQGRKEARA